jgi:hypothetical protein
MAARGGHGSPANINRRTCAGSYLGNCGERSWPHKAKLYDSRLALETLYLGRNGSEFITTAEAVRRLTIAKEKEIVLDMEIKRGSRVPLEDVLQSDTEIFQMFAGTLKANHNKLLTQEVINEIFETLRNWLDE